MKTYHFITVPNIITLLRLILTPIIIVFLCYTPPQFKGAFLLTVIVSLSDFFDGYLARRMNQRSLLGTYLDPIADKILALSLFYVFFYYSIMPLALLICMVVRDLILTLGAIFLNICRVPFAATPLFVGKLHTFIQLVLIIICLAIGMFENTFDRVPDLLVVQLLIKVLWVTTFISSAAYLWRGFKTLGMHRNNVRDRAL